MLKIVQNKFVIVYFIANMAKQTIANNVSIPKEKTIGRNN